MMQAAYDMEYQGQADQAYEEYCRGLRIFLQATRQLGQEATDKAALMRQVEQQLSKATKLKERIAKAGLSIASLVALPSKQQEQQQPPQRSRSPQKRPLVPLHSAGGVATAGQDGGQPATQ